MEQTEHRVSAVGVLDKAALILGALTDGSRSLHELQSATGLPRATVHRLAVALEAHDLLRRDPEGRFALGFGLASLGRAAVDSFPLGAAARPALEALRAETEESVQLYVRDGERRVCVESLESPHGLRTIVAVGAALPLELGSAGRVLRGDAATLRRGWAESVAEREPGVASVSAPVRSSDGEVIAAIGVSGPIGRTSRHPGRRYSAAVRRAAQTVERAINGR